MLLWANFLHFYQPPDQKRFMMEKIANESYRPLINILLKKPQAHLTFNISGCLLDKLDEFSMTDVIDGWRELLKRGTIELCASAKYHPFLPLIRESEVKRQIMLNNNTLRYFFGDLYKPQGFFSPEAGYSRKLATLVASLGFRFMIVDEIAYSGKLSFRGYDFSSTPGFYSGGLELERIVGKVTAQMSNVVDYGKLYTLHGLSNLAIFFRQRVISDAIASGQINSASQFMNIIKEEVGKQRYLLTGTDGEAYGHHQPGLIKVLDGLLSSSLKTVTISSLFKYFKKRKVVEPISSTWGTSEAEIEEGLFFSRWLDPRNKIHKMQWQLTDLAIEAVEQAKGRGDPGYPKARMLLDRALYSCHFWWVTARPWWSIEIIERGAYALVKVIEVLHGPIKRATSMIRIIEANGVEVPHGPIKRNKELGSGKYENDEWKKFTNQKRKAKRLYQQIVFTAFDWMRHEFVKDLSHLHK